MENSLVPAAAATAQIAGTQPPSTHTLDRSARSAWPLLMLFSRISLFAIVQLIIAGLLGLQGKAAPFGASAAWWPVVAPIASAICLALLLWRLRAEGLTSRQFLGFERAHLWHDLAAVLGIFVVCIALALLPSTYLGRLLFGSETIPNALLLRPLPYLAALLGGVLAFPLLQGVTELPVYFGYVMPRLAVRWRNRWLAWLAASLMLAAEHCALPLVLDLRFIAWRFLMFLPFALWIGLALKWRPRLLPYVMVFHALIDLGTGALILALAVA